ncbi:MAG: hypothetical protein GC200_01640 [Tepidisphaera sp.]|nr:hypothetical protein [Tepidisphaera sp.]
MRQFNSRLLKVASCLALGALAGAGGCASESRSADVYTYSPQMGGNVCASDALGARMMKAETYRQAMLIKQNQNLAQVRE